MILLTTGHFAGGNGARAFIKRHKGDLVKRTNAALTIEHLGLREWNELSGGQMGSPAATSPARSSRPAPSSSSTPPTPRSSAARRPRAAC